LNHEIKKGIAMLTKEKILTGIRKLPDSVTMDEVLDHIVLLEKIENGLDQADKGQTLTEEEMDEKISKWLD
jgi:predicted transcriptional regulator